jgi:hypothetical protein
MQSEQASAFASCCVVMRLISAKCLYGGSAAPADSDKPGSHLLVQVEREARLHAASLAGSGHSRQGATQPVWMDVAE